MVFTATALTYRTEPLRCGVYFQPAMFYKVLYAAILVCTLPSCVSSGTGQSNVEADTDCVVMRIATDAAWGYLSTATSKEEFLERYPPTADALRVGERSVYIYSSPTYGGLRVITDSLYVAGVLVPRPISPGFVYFDDYSGSLKELELRAEDLRRQLGGIELEIELRELAAPPVDE